MRHGDLSFRENLPLRTKEREREDRREMGERRRRR